jgi:hypothetical protein
MLDSYHRPDDMAAFRRVIPNYEYSTFGCRLCDSERSLLVPLVTFWRPVR